MAEDAVALWDAVRRAGREAVRARRARHAAPRGLLPAARQRHRPRHGRDLRRPRLGLRARHGVHRGRGAAPDQGGRAGAKLVAFVMQDPGIPRQGMAIDEGGEVTSGSHSPMLDRGIGMGYVDAEHADPGDDAHDRRPRQAAPRGARQETDLQEGGIGSGRSRELPRRAPLQRRARLGEDRGRRGDPRDHLVRAGLARRPRPLRAAGGRRRGGQGLVLRRGRVGEGGLGR